MAIQEKIDLIKTQVANAHTAVGTKGGTPGVGTSSLEAAIFSIPEGGGIDTSDANATAEQILEGFNAYVDGEKVEGAIATYTGSDSFVPTTSNITIPTGSSYVETDLTIVGSANLVNTNIKKDVVIFGVTGSYEGSGGGMDTSDATATAAHIVAGETAYIASGKVTGVMPVYSVPGPLVPTAENYAIDTAGKYVPSNIVIAGDEHLVSANIKSGVSIFGVEGAYEGGGMTDAGTLNVSNNGSYTPTAGSGYTAVHVNVAGGETVAPTVYAKLERILIRTPADAVVDYAGVWTRDSAWLALADVPMTFQSGSFGWTGTRALARYTKTVNGTTVYLYLYYLDGYYYDDTTAWDAIGVANAQQFFDNIGTLGWSDDMYMNYCFSTTDYTPAQITNYNSVTGDTPFGTYSQASAQRWTIPSPFTGPWDLLGLEDMGMGGGSDILQTYSSKSSASVTLAVSANWDSFYEWNSLSRNNSKIHNIQWGRLLDENNSSSQNYPGGDPITGTWSPYTDTVWPTNNLTKRYEWYNSATGMYAAELSGTGYSYWWSQQTCGLMFMQRPLPLDYGQARDDLGAANAYCSWGRTWFPVYRMRSVTITNGGSGYQVGDLIRFNYRISRPWAPDSDGVPGVYFFTEDKHINVIVTDVDENGAVTEISDMLYYNTGRTTGTGNDQHAWWAWERFLLTVASEGGGVIQPTFVPDWNITNSASGTGFTCELHSKMFTENPDYEPIFGAEREVYWCSSYGDNSVGNYNEVGQFPKIYELYKLTTSLSPIISDSIAENYVGTLYWDGLNYAGDAYVAGDSSWVLDAGSYGTDREWSLDGGGTMKIKYNSTLQKWTITDGDGEVAVNATGFLGGTYSFSNDNEMVVSKPN